MEQKKQCMHGTGKIKFTLWRMPTWESKEPNETFSAKDLHEPSSHVCQGIWCVSGTAMQRNQQGC